MNVARLVKELRRRHVFKVAVTYAIVAWIAMQVGEVAFPPLGIPDWALTLVIVLLALFFPVAIVLAWAFDMTAQGIVRTGPVDDPVAANGAGSSTPAVAATTSALAAQPAPVEPDVLARSIVVLPFDNMSAEAENEYLSDGIAEDLIIQLSKFDALRVISRASAWQYKDRGGGARDIGRELGVAYILSGSVRRSGERLRIAAELVDARSDDHLWADTYDRQLRDLFDIQTDVATSIVAAVDASLSPSAAAVAEPLAALPPVAESDRRRSAPPTSDLAAYDHYLRGRHHWNRRSPEDLERSIAELSQAAGMDPDFMLAHAGLADSYITLAIYGERAPRDVMPLARAAADRAMALDSGAAESLTARACVSAIFEWDWSRSEVEFERAVRASPPYVTARMWYAMHHLLPLKRFAGARAHLDAALLIDPLSATVRVSRAALRYYERAYEEAIDDLLEVIHGHSDFALAHLLLGLARVGAGAADEAVEALLRARELAGGSVEATVALGQGLVARGRQDAARGLLAELVERGSSEYVSASRLAQLFVGLGERERALEALARAAEERASDLVWLDVMPAFDPLRDDPEFGRLRALVLP
ncbi:MAG: hypothetical protein ABFS34_07685 [Gemmatimonadota bacterium]